MKHCRYSFRYVLTLALLPVLSGMCRAQWQMQTSGTKASLRGIHAVDSETAWVSGTDGTVMKTTDGGQRWQSCSTPPGAGKLDFRSVWAWNSQDAMVMSSGPGVGSKLYSTHDGCRTWRLVLTNPDAEGFWDSLQFDGTRFGVILGDPVAGSFVMYATYDGGVRWTRQTDACLRTMQPQQGAFAASNQSMVVVPSSRALPGSGEQGNGMAGAAMSWRVWFGTSGGWLYGMDLAPMRLIAATTTGCSHRQVLPTGTNKPSNPATGIFAVAFRNAEEGVAVGGDYTQPRDASATAAYTVDGESWQPALHPPAGYRSTVVWNASEESWLAAGPDGSDASRDNGKTWTPFDHENWNALGLPFAVGPDGRIGRLVSWGQLRVMTVEPKSALFLQRSAWDFHLAEKGQ